MISSMRKSLLRQIILYNHRYTVGVTAYLLLLIGLLFFQLDLAPTGLTEQEMDSAVASATWNITQPLSQSLVEAPYRFLQKASLSLIGINKWGVIAPSLLLGLLTGLAFVLMVRRWFKLNIALITGLIFVSSSAFLIQARTGTPMIMTSFWLSIILWSATNIINPKSKKHIWGFILLSSALLSLYTPLMIYPLLAMLVAGILHPHIRFLVRKVTNVDYIIATVAIIVLLGPLFMSLVKDPHQLLILAGLPESTPTLTGLLGNVREVVVSFFSLTATQVGFTPRPIFGAATLILAILGLIKTIVDRHSARAYMLLIWSGLFLPIAVMNPHNLLISLVPAHLFLAIGIETIIREWYKLFPLNPYARLAGLVPLTVLLGSMMLSGSTQYFYGYFYGTPQQKYTEQLQATNDFIESTDKTTPITVVTLSKQAGFYDLIRRDHDNVSIAISAPTRPEGAVIVHAGATYAPQKFGTPSHIVTSYKSQADQVIARQFQP